MSASRTSNKAQPRTKPTPKGQRHTIDRLRDLWVFDLDAGTTSPRYDNKGGRKAGQRAGTKCSDGYRVLCGDGVRILEHVAIWAATKGSYPPDGHVVHHRNTIRDDNRWDNLELKPESDHQREHRINEPGTAASGAKNVHRDEKNKCYRASVMAFGIRYQPTFSDSTYGGQAGAFAAAKKVAATLRDERQGPLAEGRHALDIIAEIKAVATREAREAVLAESEARRQSRQQARRAGGARQVISGNGRPANAGSSRRGNGRRQARVGVA